MTQHATLPHGLQKLFLVGCPRSGTTVLQQALNRHPNIIIPAETAYFVDFVGRSVNAQRRAIRHIARDLDIELSPVPRRVRAPRDVICRYEEIATRCVVQSTSKDAVYFGDKTPHHLLVLPDILRFFPKAKILLVYRDGRDVALSLKRVRWAPPGLYANFWYWLRHARRHLWARSQREITLLEVRYEDFVHQPSAICKDICAFLGLSYHAGMSTASGDSTGIPEWEIAWKRRATQAISTDRVGVWKRELTPKEIAVLDSWGGETLRALGYHVSDPSGLPAARFLPLLWELSAWYAKRGARWMRRTLLPVSDRESWTRE